jgi:hypothetical protein
MIIIIFASSRNLYLDVSYVLNNILNNVHLLVLMLVAWKYLEQIF